MVCNVQRCGLCTFWHSQYSSHRSKRHRNVDWTFAIIITRSTLTHDSEVIKFSPCVCFLCVGHNVCPHYLTMKDWCHTHTVLQVYRWKCVVVQVKCHVLMMSSMTSPGRKVGQFCNSPFRELATRGTSTNQIAASWMLQATWLATVASRHIVWQALLISL